VAVAQFRLAVAEQLREREVYIAEAEETEIVGLNTDPSGAKARLK
jgi:hypothetical protein